MVRSGRGDTPGLRVSVVADVENVHVRHSRGYVDASLSMLRLITWFGFMGLPFVRLAL